VIGLLRVRYVVLRAFWAACFYSLCSLLAFGQSTPVHGLWVWKSPSVLAAPNAAEELRNFCKAQGITEIYVSIAERSKDAEETQLIHLIRVMHRESVHVEALLSSTEADEPGKHRETLVHHAEEVVEFNRKNAPERFDGIHLDIEPQQRAENKGPGNLRFLPGLAEAFREVRKVAEPARLTVNADIQNKLLKGDAQQRKALLTAVPRVTLMMYELSSPDDGSTETQKADKVAAESGKFLAMAYDGLSEGNLAKMAIALRTPDYKGLLSEMLQRLDSANRGNPHYLGWARHSYNDMLK
jgi:hypothetical protein